MILTHVLGNLSDPDFSKGPEKKIDELPLEYTDAQKHILRAVTKQGRDIAIRLSPEAQLAGLRDGDVLTEEDQTLVVIRVLPVPAGTSGPSALFLCTAFSPDKYLRQTHPAFPDGWCRPCRFVPSGVQRYHRPRLFSRRG